MAYKHREELVGKRFLSVSSTGKLKLSKISNWEWRAGVIRAASHRNPKHPELSILVEFDDVDWKRREWIRVYEDNLFQVFAIEITLVWLPRKQFSGGKSLSTYWPGVNYKILVDDVGLSDNKNLPVEYLVHKDLVYVDYSELKLHQVDLSDNNCLSVVHNHPEVAKAIGHWSQFQDGQRILLTTPSVLVGYRVEVYRAEGTTQWYTAVIVSYNENTKELTLTDDTVLEEHNEDPSLVQMRLIGDGVVESILRGENIGITPRRRSCTAQHQQHLGHYTRTRSQLPNQFQCHRSVQNSTSRKTKVRSGNEVANSADSEKDKEKSNSFVKDKKIKSGGNLVEQENSLSGICEVNPNKRSSNKKTENCCNKSNVVSNGNSVRSGSGDLNIDLEANDGGLKTICEKAVKASHHHRRRQKESKESVNHEDSEDEERAAVIKNNDKSSSKSHLKSKLREKSSKDKSKCAAVRSQENKNKTLTVSKNNSVKEEEREEIRSPVTHSPPTRTKVKKCSVIVDAVERHSSAAVSALTSLSEVQIKRPATVADCVRSATVEEEQSSPSNITCLSDESTPCGIVSSADNNGADLVAGLPSFQSSDDPQPSPTSVECETRSSDIECENSETDVGSSEHKNATGTEIERPQHQPNEPSIDVPVSDAGMPPESYVKLESENVTDCDQTRLSCTPDNVSCANNRSNNNNTRNNNDVDLAENAQVVVVRDSETNRKAEDAKEVRKVEESSANRADEIDVSGVRNSPSTVNSLVLDPNEPVRIWRDPKLVGSGSSVFHITSVQHSNMAHPAGARSHPYSSGGGGSSSSSASGTGSGGGSGGGSSLQSPHPGAAAGRTSSGAIQSHFPPLHMSPHPSMSHVPNSAAYLEHKQATMRIPSNSGAVVVPQPPPPQTSVPSQHQYPSHHPPHVITPHHLMPQYTPMHNMDIVWQQKYSQVQPWMMQQFSDDRDRAAAILVERDRQARILERDRRDQAEHIERAKEKQERMERERREQEKLEKEKLERDRIQKEREKQQEMERIKKEKAEKERELQRERERERLDQERARREVHHHFEESFRLAQYKQQMPGWNIVPSRQTMVETSSSTPSSHHSGESGRGSSRNSSVVHSSHSHPASSYPNSHKPADLSKDSRMVVCGSSGEARYLSPEEQRRLSEEEKWSAMKRQQDNNTAMAYSAINMNSRNSDTQQRSSSAHSCYPGSDTGHNANLRIKQEYVVNSNFPSAPKSSSVPMANSGGGGNGGVKVEQTSPNFNIYGYQPFHHSYILADRRGSMVATVPDNHKYNPVDIEPNRASVSGTVTQSVNVPPSPHQRSGRCSPPITMQESDRRRRSIHGSVIVCGENVRHDNSKVATTSVMSSKHQHKMSHGQPPDVPNSVYENQAAFKSFEMNHGQTSVQVPNDGHMGRMVSQIHPYGEPQNFHKLSATHHEQSQHHHHQQQQQHHQQHQQHQQQQQQHLQQQQHQQQQYISSRQGSSRSSSHQSPNSSNYGPNVISPTSSKSGQSVNYGSDLIQQGLVPNPMYNHSSGSGRSITHGAASLHHNSGVAQTSPPQKISKSVNQTSGGLSLPARSSPGTMYGKASIVAGTPLCRPNSNMGQSPVSLTPSNYSLHTPPPAHHNGSRSQSDHVVRPASAHSQPPLPGPQPSHTAMSGQTSHSPIDRSLSASRGTPLNQSQMNSEIQMYSNSISSAANLSVNLSPHVASPHVPSPIPMPQNLIHGHSNTSVAARPSPHGTSVLVPLPSPPQTQPLDLQAPDRQRESRSVSPGKRKSLSKDISQRKRPKTVVMSVANEGLAAAVASVHQIMSSNAAGSNFVAARSSSTAAAVPFPTNVVCPSLPTAAAVSNVVTTNVNTNSLDSLSKPALITGPLPTTQNSSSNSSSSVQVASTTGCSPNKDSGFLNIYRTFVHSSQQNQSQNVSNYAVYPYGKLKAKHMAAKTNIVKQEDNPVPNTHVETIGKSLQVVTSASVNSAAGVASTMSSSSTAITPPKPVQSNPVVPSSVIVNGPSEHPEKAISPALSNASSTSTCGTSIPKLKKEWLIRHSNEDGKNTVRSEDVSQIAVGSICSSTVTAHSGSIMNQDNLTMEKESNNNNSVTSTGLRSLNASAVDVSVNGHMSVKIEPSECNSVDNSETESVSTTSTVKSASKRTTRSKKRKQPKKEPRQSKSKHIDHSESNQEDDKELDADDEPLIKRVNVTPRKRGRKPKTKSTRADAVRKTKSAKSSSAKMKKPSIARLKRTGESYLQKGPCCEVAPKLSKCRECRLTQFQRSKKMPNIFCRFYEFRRLKYTKNGFITIAGFSEPKDASDDDLKLWLPPVDDPASDLKVDTSYFILMHVGDQFCDLVEQEREAQAMHMNEDKTVAWKRVVQGVREMCDVCETTLFNIHWACNKCGFVVCIDCYKARRNGTVKEEETPGKDRDSFSWLMCNSKQIHEQDKLMLTQIIAGNALWDMGKYVHEIRKKWQIANYCSCSLSKSDNNNKKPAVNGFCKQLMSAVSKCFGPDVVNEPTNGGPESIKNNKLTKVNNNLNGSLDYIKSENVTGYNPDSSSPLSWLADVALHSSGKLESGGAQKNKENQSDVSDGKDNVRHSPNYSSDTDDGKNNENYSTLRELLIRPTSKNANSNNKTNSVSSSTRKKISTLDEVISHVIEQSVNNIDKFEKSSKDGVKLLHYSKRFPQPKHGREPLPIRVFTLEESKVLYPDVPHSWLCNGRLLRLIDPDHRGNLKLFQEQWKRGQPVLVSEINKRLDNNLWHPDSFSRDYGDKKNDLVNCSTGTIVPNQPMKKFWDGFETYAKRMKDENGEYMLLKLKDWPPGDDFSEMLPSRFEDLMKALPLPEYTHRNGLLNIAGRLPECFVRPDLGPKMYNAYGSAMHPDKGTTNLHLDISDAVNVMVYVGIPKDSDSIEHVQEALRAIEEGGCDTLMLRRVREKGSKPGALWHIYNARDADKIRDLLNKVAIERGETLEPHHDPIHDQSWYLDGYLRQRLYKEYGVEGYAIAQCLGDAVFIPAGAPHQVRNLHSCIKVAEDFVSPENISHCFTLTQEFRDLSDTHTNHEDKLQVKNIIYHAVRDALALLMKNDPANYIDIVKCN